MSAEGARKLGETPSPRQSQDEEEFKRGNGWKYGAEAQRPGGASGRPSGPRRGLPVKKTNGGAVRGGGGWSCARLTAPARSRALPQPVPGSSKP